MKHARFLAGIGVAAGLTAAGMNAVFAETDGSTPTNPMTSLVQAIATKFNLSESDVQQVFNEQHELMQQERQQAFADRVSEAVEDGTLTQEQADTILAKVDELEANKPTQDDSLTPEERHEQMQEALDGLREWAKENEIPREFVPMLGHGGPGNHMGRPGHMFGMQSADTQVDNGDTAVQ